MPPASTNPLQRVPRDADRDHAPELLARRHALCEEAAGMRLPHLAGAPVPSSEGRGKVENMVGFVQVPVGIAGPLSVVGAEGEYEVYVPMATTEGAMVASYSRGMRLLRESGGARARVVARGLSQHPILVYRSLEQSLAAAEVAREALPELREITAGLTRHGKLVRVEPEVLGRRLVVRLLFETGDAIGINMAAQATDRCTALLAERTGAVERYVHGQDVEKRSSARALNEGRGRSAVAECTVPREVLAGLCRTTPEDMAAISRTYSMGFAALGTQNWLVQAANGLAAVMLACGQDVAYLTECATGHLELEVTPSGDLYAAAILPSLPVGTVGGGALQGTARECLAILGCAREKGVLEGSADRFAEVLAATVLAGDLSLMAAFCAHEFVDAHERLGRNRPGGEDPR